jgi:hypothetical protein
MDSGYTMVSHECLNHSSMHGHTEDDKLVGKMYKILDWFAINVGKAKQDAKES